MKPEHMVQLRAVATSLTEAAARLQELLAVLELEFVTNDDNDEIEPSTDAVDPVEMTDPAVAVTGCDNDEIAPCSMKYEVQAAPPYAGSDATPVARDHDIVLATNGLAADEVMPAISAIAAVSLAEDEQPHVELAGGEINGSGQPISTVCNEPSGFVEPDADQLACKTNEQVLAPSPLVVVNNSPPTPISGCTDLVIVRSGKTAPPSKVSVSRKLAAIAAIVLLISSSIVIDQWLQLNIIDNALAEPLAFVNNR